MTSKPPAENGPPVGDWNLLWQEALRKKRWDRSDKAHWNRRAASFAQHSRKNGYAREFLHLMQPQPDWSVLDVGCGAGTLALPLSPLVRRITAIDFSENMIALLREACSDRGLDNIHTEVVGWEDDWDQAGIGKHDVAIASRSLVVHDLRAALLKLADKANFRVYISSLVGDGPFDRRLFEAAGRELDRGPDYIYVYNLLYQMGIHAEVRFVHGDPTDKPYRDVEDALERFQWMFNELTDEERAGLRAYLKHHLIRAKEGWTLSYQHIVRWAVISWEKEPCPPPRPA
ncbi:MAG: class I SAM-dependent DNA methyltransferase [Desulfobulbus sp.]|jgi:SAM-dependent methyltransferase